MELRIGEKNRLVCVCVCVFTCICAVVWAICCVCVCVECVYSVACTMYMFMCSVQ